MITTVYYPLSHCDVMVSRWIEPRPRDHEFGWGKPRTQIASMHVAQFPANDMARHISSKHGIPLFDTVRGALMLGGDRLAVDAVLLIGEHGDYPFNAVGQKLYPRKEFFDQIVEVFRREQRVVPMFCDKHLSWNFDSARAMVETARAMNIPFLAGSSLSHMPLDPPLTLAPACELDEVVTVFFDSPEAYGFHSFEVIQSVIERRVGGESGIHAIRAVRGENVWRALDSGAWSDGLMHAAIAATKNVEPGSYRDNCRRSPMQPAAFCVEHADGLRVTHVMLHGHVKDFALALRMKPTGNIQAARVAAGDTDNFYAHFACLNRVIEDMFLSGHPPVPCERTLLTTGATAACMDALAAEGQRRVTPQLQIKYSV